MRHYMVCPQNEEMLHKIPPHVRDAIKNEAIRDCIAAVEAAPGKFWDEASDADQLGWLAQHELYVTALRALLEGEKP